MGNQQLTIVDTMVKNTIKEKLLEEYSTNSLLRGLVQIVPYGGLVDTILTSSYNNILVERAKVFYDELGIGMIELKPELVQSEDFLHAYFSTFKAALYTKQREKIRFFSRLLNGGLTSSLIHDADEYDDYLKILDELTFREIYILFKLKEIEDETGGFSNHDHWNIVQDKMHNELKIDSEQLRPILSRIERTGCLIEFETFVGGSGGRGSTSSIFNKLISLIKLEKEDLIYYSKSI